MSFYFSIRIKNSTADAKQLKMHQYNVSKTARNDVFNVYTNETNTNDYQELQESNKAETYDLI